MGKNKLARWAELENLRNVIQQVQGEDLFGDHKIKGNWRREIFRNENPIIVELGCGHGEYTTGLAMLFPRCNYIGVDIKGARLWRGAKTANEKSLDNAAFLRTRIEFISNFFAIDEVDEIWLTFPDPHPGKKNSNKRLTCPWFLNKYRIMMKNRGIIHLKTDNAELHAYTEKLAKEHGLEILFSTDDMRMMKPGQLIVSDKYFAGNTNTDYIQTNLERILSIRTHYENKFMGQGLKINYLAFRIERERSVSNDWEKTI